MRNMLTKDDFLRIGSLMDERTETILSVVKTGFDGVDRRFEGLEIRMDGLEGRMDGLETRMDGLDSRMDGFEGQMNGLKGQMVTKDHLERAFDRFEVRLIERLDHRYVRR